MLTERLGRARDWALFSAAAIAPAIAVGALGLRALANEEAGARREVGLGLAAVASSLARETDLAIAKASRDLEAASVDADAEKAATTLGRIAPRFAAPVLLARDRSMLVPAPPAPPPIAAASSTPALPIPRCRELAAAVAQPPPRDEARVAAARGELLAGCPEVAAASGRLLWSVVALDAVARGLPLDGRVADRFPDRIADWIAAHASRLAEPEREATRGEVERSLQGSARDRALAALAPSWSRRDALVAALQSPGAAAAIRALPGARGLVTWRAEASVGAIRQLDDGRLAGFVVDARSLEAALVAGAFAVPADVRVTVVSGRRAALAPGDAAQGLVAERLVAPVTVAPELGLRVVPSDPGAVARHASRSRRILAALGGFATVAAFALAAALFARMRSARRTSALRTDFVAAVSHELRTPIASLRMLAELLQQGRVEPAEQPEVFDALARESRRLGETVERMLQFSRMTAGRNAASRVESRLAAVVAASIDTFEERYPEIPRVVRDLDEGVIADVDAGQVRLAVDNLLANARKYAPSGAPYRVTVRRDGEGAAITVADSGPGVARRDRARIFEPFERADDRLSRATEGTGIGLSLVRHVARAHGGRATVTSEEGKGAAFTLWLPTARDDEDTR